jgi:hypothetical protein
MAIAESLAHINVNPHTVQTAVDGFGKFTVLAGSYLSRAGIGKLGADGTITIDTAVPVPMMRWLATLEAIRTSVGDLVMRQIGEAIPRRAVFPPSIVDLRTALESIDVAYHMNHAADGRPMFDPDTGEMVEGIGHYSCESIGPGAARVACDNPYPCAFDMGLYLAMASRFAKNVTVVHEPGGCRAEGGRRCAYLIRWTP